MNDPSTHTIRKALPKKHEKLIWIANSTAVLFAAFWTICILQDMLVWLVGNVIGVPIRLSFDHITLSENINWSTIQVLIIYGFVPLFYGAIAVIAGILHKHYRLKRDLRKLYFLWTQYLALSILGGSFVTSFIDRGNITIFWEYLRLNIDFLPIVAFVSATLLIFFGTLSLWKFLNIAPSSEINKNPSKRLLYILCVQIIPLIIFFVAGFILYPNLHATSRYFSAIMIWVPIFSGIIASVARDSGFAKVPAFKDSDVRTFQPLYLGYAALVYLAILLVS